MIHGKSLTDELEELLRNANLRTDQDIQPELSNQSLEQELPPLNSQNSELFGVDPMMLSEQNLAFDRLPLTDPGPSNAAQQSANQLIDLGIFEQLPSFDLIDELYDKQPFLKQQELLKGTS